MKHCPQCSASYPEEYAVCPKDGTRLSGAGVWEPDSVIRGKYKIVARIGEGGMATVFKAHHQLLDEARALKVIKPELARDEQFVQRFKNEAINTRKLQHPNAVRVDDLDLAEDGRPFMAMELVEGESLKGLIVRTGPLGHGQVLDISLQVCEALRAAHALGLVHRDIKPDNIVLVPRASAPPLVKILDFGIARLKEAASKGAAGMTLTGTGVVIGTPDYMSPEQAMGKRGEEIDGRSDLYSLGIVMYRMVTGELPFKADTTVEMILHHIQTPPKPPNTLRPDLLIPDAVSSIIMKALEKNREQRYESASAMAEAIRKAQERLTVVTHSPLHTARRSSATAATAALPAGFARSRRPAGTVGITPPSTALTPGAAPLGATAGGPPERLQTFRPSAAPSAMPPLRPASPQPIPPRTKFGAKRRALGAALAFVLAIALVAGLKRHKRAQSEAAPPIPSAEKDAPVGGTSNLPATSPADALGMPTQVSTPNLATSPGRPARAPRRVKKSENSQRAERLQKGAAPTPEKYPTQPPAEEAPRVLSPMPGQGGGGQPSGRPAIRQINDRATQFMDAGEYRRAARLFMQALELDPTNKRAQNGLAKCREKFRESQQGARPRM